MKRLILMRHAKSDWDAPARDDHERPLNARGKRGARVMGEWLRAEGFLPEVALVSTARRTRETWEMMSAAMGAEGGWEPCPAQFEDDLYHAAPAAMLAALRAAGADPALMLGHQPGIGAFAREMLAEEPEDEVFDRFPTAAVAVIDFAIADWGAVAPGTGRLAAFMAPGRLP